MPGLDVIPRGGMLRDGRYPVVASGRRGAREEGHRSGSPPRRATVHAGPGRRAAHGNRAAGAQQAPAARCGVPLEARAYFSLKLALIAVPSIRVTVAT